MRNFILSVQQSEKAEDERFLFYVKSKGMGYWHFISGTWILAYVGDEITTEHIRDVAIQIYGSPTLVMEILVMDYAGFGPADETPGGKNMFPWLERNLGDGSDYN